MNCPASAQLGLLRVLKKEQNSTIPRTLRDAVQPDVRLICTTSRDLGGEVEAGRFLPELFDCIGVLPIEMPPLGRRREDIPLLVSHFLEQASEPGDKRRIYTPQAIESLATTDWPENVRQLFDLVKQDLALSHGTPMNRELMQKSMPEDRGSIPTYDEAREAFARAYLAENLQRTEGNVAQAARPLEANPERFLQVARQIPAATRRLQGAGSRPPFPPIGLVGASRNARKSLRALEGVAIPIR